MYVLLSEPLYLFEIRPAGLCVRMDGMDEIEDQEHEDIDAPRGGSMSGIAAALARPAGAGLPHWGGPAPRRRTTETETES